MAHSAPGTLFCFFFFSFQKGQINKISVFLCLFVAERIKKDKRECMKERKKNIEETTFKCIVYESPISSYAKCFSFSYAFKDV